jgi:predicted metal-dependent enzyme (double-stranded beta helix superfamily)
MTTLTAHPRSAADSALTTDNLAAIVEEFADRPDIWLDRVTFLADDRWWTRLHSDETVDVWLITWAQDTGTELHDHGGSRGAFVVASGTLAEVRPVGPHHLLVATELTAGDVHPIERGAIHDVSNPLRTPAISIHAYSPPLREMTFYRQSESGPVPVRTTSAIDGSPE